jgi:bifunctional NMN adenylyltransferase/nudix hydrolase
MLGVYIGRFQPFHAEHAKIAAKALEECDSLLLLVGVSLSDKCSPKNPFPSHVIEDTILCSFHSKDKARIKVIPLFDNPSDKLWVREVKHLIHFFAPGESKIALYGGHKDESSSYLNWFPEFEDRTLKCIESSISGSKIRELLYTDQPVPEHYFATKKAYTYVLRASKMTSFLALKEEYRKLQTQKGEQ